MGTFSLHRRLVHANRTLFGIYNILMPNAPVLIALFYSEQSKHFFPTILFLSAI